MKNLFNKDFAGTYVHIYNFTNRMTQGRESLKVFGKALDTFAFLANCPEAIR
jgi:hypothetical protein